MTRRSKELALVLVALYWLTTAAGSGAADNGGANPQPAGPPAIPAPAMGGPAGGGQFMVSPPIAVPVIDSSGKSAYRPTTGEQAIKRALNDNATFDYQGMPLSDAMTDIADKHKIAIQFDLGSLKDAGVDPRTALVTMNARDISLRSALNLLLGDFNLKPVIKNEVLMVVSKDKADADFDTRLYDVRDLVMREFDPNGEPDFDSLIDGIRTTVNPQSWDKGGGQGAIAPFGRNGIYAIMVWQNYDGHEQVENMLAELRRLKPVRGMNQ